MYFEIQLTSDAFCRIVRNATKWIHLDKMEKIKSNAFTPVDMCRINGLDSYTDKDNVKHDLGFVVDHIEILAETTVRSEQTNFQPTKSNNFKLIGPGSTPMDVTVPYLQVLQPINIVTATADQLQSAGPDPATYKTNRLVVVLDVWLEAGNGAAFLKCKFHEIIPPLPSEQKAVLEPLLENMVTIPAIPLDLTQIEAALSRSNLKVVNAGIVCSAGADFVALRIDFDIDASGPDVTEAFFEDELPPSVLGGNDWALFIDQNFICAEAVEKLVAGIAKHPDKIRIDGDGEVWWQGDATNPHVELRYPVEVTKKGWPWISCTADIRGVITCTPGPVDTLTYTYYLSANPRGATSFVFNYLLPILGPPLWDAIADGQDMTKYIPPLSDKMACGALSNSAYQCVLEVLVLQRLPPGYRVRFSLDNLSGITRGLVIGGRIGGLNEIPAPQISLDITPFGWDLEGDCKTGFSIVCKARIQVAETANLCDVVILDNPHNEFWATIRRDEDIVHPGLKLDDNAVDIYAKGTADYANDPVKQPCRVRLITNGGVRTITFDPPAPMTDDERRQLDSVKQSLVGVCQDWELAHHLPDTNIVPPGPIDGPDWAAYLTTTLVVLGAGGLGWASLALHDQIAQIAGPTVARMTPFVTIPAAVLAIGARLLGAALFTPKSGARRSTDPIPTNRLNR